MKTSIFVTNSPVGKGHGGGVVCYNIIQALKSVTNLQTVFCEAVLNTIPSLGVPTKIIRGRACEPLLIDFTVYHQIHQKVDIAQFYGGPFGQTLQKLKPAKTIVDIAPHNIQRSREEFEQWKMPFSFPHLTDSELRERYMLHIKLADLVIVHSKTSAQYITDLLCLQNEVRVLPHGCNLPKTIKPVPEKFTVAHVSQLGPDKGQIYLLLAWNMLALEDSELVIAGTETQRLVEFVELKSPTKCLGYVDDVNALYDNASVYVQPSVTEGFSLTTLEAMAYSRPVIVTEGAGVSELVEDGKDGFVVPIRNPKIIAEKIQYFYDNSPSELKRMGQNARHKAERFTWDKVRKMYESIYLECS